MINIHIQDKQITDMIHDVESRARALGGGRASKVVYRQLGGFALRDVQDNFKKQGPGWKSLALSTQKQRKKQGYGPQRPILRRRGANSGLFGSIHTEAFSNRAEVAANKVYAAVLHFGAAAGSLWKGTYTVPARRIKSHKRKTRGGKTVTVKAHVRKAHTRQGQAPWGDIPPRPYMRVNQKFYERSKRFLGRYITKGKTR